MSERRLDSRKPAQGRLLGVGVVLTRPAHQTAGLARLVESEGGHVIRFPVLEIGEVEDGAPALTVIDQLQACDLAIFVSPNAVEWGMKLVGRRRTFPPRLKLAAVGKGTANALERRGLRRVIYPPDTFNSEALLALPELQARSVARRRVVIFRGQGGRECLARTLRDRGAQVDYAEVYGRQKPAVEPARVTALMGRRDVDVVVITSTDGLRNLMEMLGAQGRDWLSSKALVLASERIRGVAEELGITGRLTVASRSSDEALMAAIRDGKANG